MRAALENHSSFPRLAWTEVSVPHGVLSSDEATFITDRGQKLRAVRGKSRAEHNTFYRVFTPFNGDIPRIEGELQDKPLVEGVPFMPTDWVTDNFEALVPGGIVRIGGKDYRVENPAITPVESSAAHQRWHVRGRLAGAASGWLFEAWVTFYHMQDVADVEGHVTWSDPTVEHVYTEVEAVGLECGEYIALDFAERNGHEGPFQHQGKWTWVLTGPLGADDGTSVPFQGRMLCVKQKHSDGFSPDMAVEVEAEETDEDADYNMRIQSLLAAWQGPVTGVVLDQSFNSRFLAHRWSPRNRAGTMADADRYHEERMRMYAQEAPRTIGSMKSPLHYTRPEVLNRNPADTGNQPDFGSVKGSYAVTLGDSRWIFHAGYNLQSELFRGIMHFEEDGSPVLHENHTGRVTWSGKTHFRQNPKDTLGKKSVWGSSRGTGHHGQDDQHRSWNTLCAYLALRDSPLYEAFLQHHITTDQAMQKDRLGNPRAVGRLFLAWSHAKTITEGVWHDKLKSVMDEKKAAVEKHASFNKVTGPVKVIASHRPVSNVGVTDGKGNDLPFWSVWMNSLGVIGFYAAWKATGEREYLEWASMVASTIVEFGTWEQDGRYRAGYGIWFPDNGEPITKYGVKYHTSSPQVGAGVEGWTFPSVLIHAELNPTADDPVSVKARAMRKNISADQEATEWDDAEWWACVEQVA